MGVMHHHIKFINSFVRIGVKLYSIDCLVEFNLLDKLVQSCWCHPNNGVHSYRLSSACTIWSDQSLPFFFGKNSQSSRVPLMMAIYHQERTASDSARESPLDPFGCFHGSATKQSIWESVFSGLLFLHWWHQSSLCNVHASRTELLSLTAQFPSSTFGPVVMGHLSYVGPVLPSRM